VSIACETSTQWSWALQTVSTSEGAGRLDPGVLVVPKSDGSSMIQPAAAGAIPWDEAMMGAAIAAWSGAHLWEADAGVAFWTFRRVTKLGLHEEPMDPPFLT